MLSVVPEVPRKFAQLIFLKVAKDSASHCYKDFALSLATSRKPNIERGDNYISNHVELPQLRDNLSRFHFTCLPF